MRSSERSQVSSPRDWRVNMGAGKERGGEQNSWLWTNKLIGPITKPVSPMPTSKPIYGSLSETIRLLLCSLFPPPWKQSQEGQPSQYSFGALKYFPFRAHITTHRSLFCCLVTRFFRLLTLKIASAELLHIRGFHTSATEWTCSCMNRAIMQTHDKRTKELLSGQKQKGKTMWWRSSMWNWRRL